MSCRIYIAIELDHVEGPKITQADLRERFEDELDAEQYFDESLYSLKVLGVGANPNDLDESMKRRRESMRGHV